MKFQDQLDAVVSLYDDFSDTCLKAELTQFSHTPGSREGTEADELVNFLQTNSTLIKTYPQVLMLAKLLLVMPATNAVSERSFSCLKLIKTYLRATQTQERLNNLMTLYVHKDYTDGLSLIKVANEFCSLNESRKVIFGKFSPKDKTTRRESVDCGVQAD